MRKALSHSEWAGLLAFYGSPDSPLRMQEWRDETLSLVAYYLSKQAGATAKLTAFTSPKEKAKLQRYMERKQTAQDIAAGFKSMVKKKV